MKLALLFIFTIFSCGCGEVQLREEHLNRLANGYVVIEFDAATAVVLREFEDVNKQTETIIGASVIRYQIVGDYLLGENVFSENASFAQTKPNQCGFFFIEMKNHSIDKSLSNEELTSRLIEVDISYPIEWVWIDPALKAIHEGE